MKNATRNHCYYSFVNHSHLLHRGFLGFLLCALAFLGTGLAACGSKGLSLTSVAKSEAISAPAEMRTDSSHTLKFELLDENGMQISSAESLKSKSAVQHFQTKLVTTSMNAVDFQRFSKKMKTHVVVKYPPGVAEPVQILEGQLNSWEIHTNKGDGRYSVRVELEDIPNARVFKSPPFIDFFYDVDNSIPEILVSGSLEADGMAKRRLNLTVSVGNKHFSKVNCDKAVVSYPDNPKTDIIELASQDTAGGLAAGPQIFKAKIISVSAEKTVGAFVSVSCTDALGNSANTSVPLATLGAKLAWNAQIYGKILGTSAADPTDLSKNILHSRTGELELRGKIVDLDTGQSVDSKFLELEQEHLKVYVTDFKPSDVLKLRGASSLASGAFKPSMIIPLAATYLGRHSLHASLTALDYETGLEYLVGTESFEMYFDNDAGNAKLLGSAQFVPAKKGASLTQQALFQTQGSGLVGSGLPVLEFSVDNEVWQKVEGAQWSTLEAANPRKWQVTFLYPFEQEKPYRTRIHLADFAGNEFISAVSAQIVGASDYNDSTLEKLTGTQSCLRGNAAPAARLGAALASRVTCRKKLGDGTLLNGAFLQLLFANRGEGAFEFYSSGSSPEKLGYWATNDGITKPEGKRSFQPVDAFKKLSASQRLLRNVELSSDSKAASRSQLQFGVEGTGASSFKDGTTCEAP